MDAQCLLLCLMSKIFNCPDLSEKVKSFKKRNHLNIFFNLNEFYKMITKKQIIVNFLKIMIMIIFILINVYQKY